MEFKEINLKQPTVSQFNKYPHDAYACFFTCFYMYFLTVYKITMTWVEYAEECKRIGAINDGFTILDRTAMARAAGHLGLKCCDTTMNMTDIIESQLNLSCPVPFSLNGEHFESIDGRKAIAGVPCWTVDDPGAQGDKFADCTTMEVFHLNASGERVYSKNHAGGRRKITHIYWFEVK